MVDQLIDQCGPGSEGVNEFLDLFAAVALDNESRNGCLMVMASNELSGTTPGFDDFAGAYRATLRDRLATLVRRTVLGHERAEALVQQRSELLTTFLAGFQVTVRAGASDEEIHRIVDSMHVVVDTW